MGAHDATAAVAVVAEQEMADFMGDDFRQDGYPGCILGVGKFAYPVEKDVRAGRDADSSGSCGQSEFPGVGSDLAGHAFGQNCDRDEGTDVGVRFANRVATYGALEVAPVDFDTGPAEGGFGAKAQLLDERRTNCGIIVQADADLRGGFAGGFRMTQGRREKQTGGGA